MELEEAQKVFETHQKKVGECSKEILEVLNKYKLEFRVENKIVLVSIEGKKDA